MKRQLSIFALLFIALTSYLCGFTEYSVSTPAVAFADGAWRAELENLCNRTNEAATFSRNQLQELVTKCDKLKPEIDALDDSSRKVFGKRLQLCRDFYAFMLQSKDEEGKGQAGKQ